MDNFIEYWQKVGCRFTGSCLGASNKVLALHDDWNRLLLNRSWRSYTHGVQSIDKPAVKIKIVKCQGLDNGICFLQLPASTVNYLKFENLKVSQSRDYAASTFSVSYSLRKTAASCLFLECLMCFGTSFRSQIKPTAAIPLKM
jgi:hypothetical protein